MLVKRYIKNMSVMLLAFLLVGCTYVLPTLAEENLPEQADFFAPVKLINREYIDEITFNHPLFVDLLESGNYLISRVGFKEPSVQEVNALGQVVWSFEDVQPVSAQRLPNGNTLVADSGVPGPPYSPRLIEVSPDGEVVWEHCFASLAESPRYAEVLPSGNLLVTLPFQIVELDRQHQIVWSYGSSRPVSPGSPGYLERPVMATSLFNDNVLLVDQGFAGGRVLEINKGNKQIDWQFGYRSAEIRNSESKAVENARFLYSPSSVYRLPDGNTMITDLRTQRLLEVDLSGKVVNELSWSSALQDYPLMNTWQAAIPTADRLVLALTLTSSRSRVLELDAGLLPAVNKQVDSSDVTEIK